MRKPFLDKTSVKLEDFDGGLNTKADPMSIDKNQSPDLKNVIFDDLGSVTTRNGYSLVNTAAIAAAPLDGVFTFTPEGGTAKIVAACQGTIYFLSGTTFNTVPSSQSLLTQGVNVEIRQFQNLLFVSNGNVQPYKWNGTEYTRMGVSAPTQTLSVATGAAGSPNGTYTYVYTGVNSFAAEGNYGVASPPITVTNSQISVGNIPVAAASAGINTWNVYRNTAGVQGIYYKVTSITNGIASFTDTAADSSLITAAPLDNGAPRLFKYLISHKGYLFGAGESANPSFLWYSKINQPEVWPAANFIRIGYGDGKVITGLSIVNDQLIIAKNDSMGNGSTWILTFMDSAGVSSPTNWYLKKSDSPYGSESHRSMAVYSNVLGFLCRYGFFSFYGNAILLGPADTNKGAFGADSHSYDIEPNIQQFKTALLPNAASIVFNNKLWIAVAATGSSTANDQIYQYDFVRASSQDRTIGAWSIFDAPAISQFTVLNGRLYGGSSLSNGALYLLDSGTSDNGSAINSYFVTAAIGGIDEHRSNTKVFRTVFLIVECLGNWYMNFSYFVDFHTESGTTTQIYLGPGGSTWNAMQWGVDAWGGGQTRKRVRLNLAGALGQFIQLKYSTNTVGQGFKVHEAEILYDVKGLR